MTLVYNVPKPFGGAYVHLLNNVLGAARAGFAVKLFPRTGISKYIKEDLKFLGFDIAVEEADGVEGLVYLRPSDIRSDLKYVRNINNIDVIEVNSMPLWLAAEGAVGLKGPAKFLASVVRDVLVRIMLMRSKRVVTVSSMAAKLLKRDALVEARVVPNQPLPGMGERVGAGRYLCFPSSYYYSYQGLDVFLKAVKMFDLKDYVLLIGKVNVGGLKSVVAKGVRELVKAYSLCKAVISPHKDSTPVPFFGSPTKVVDALAANKALVVSDLPSIRETIEANLKGGWDCIRFVKSGDPVSLGEAMVEVLREGPECNYELKEGPISRFWLELYNEEAK
ncbi:glycosyltransferase [Ignicoccus hospitalis]|uniref:glycosyltransferase n=1 Tax=Ignicoccus hospitalis TaxID=160233 RepID=UPI001EE29A8F|nr:glycosyltransferase [Ignicoccus hospitalis]